MEFLSLKGGCTGSSESTLVKMPHCWKSHVAAQMMMFEWNVFVDVENGEVRYCIDVDRITNNIIVRTEIQWTSLFFVYFVMCGLIAQWPSEFNISIHRLIGDIFFVTQCIVKWTVIWWNLSSFEHLHFLIYPKCTFVRITAFS